MVLLVRCQNGVVAWVARPRPGGEGVLRCVRDGQAVPMSRVVDQTWETALAFCVTHSVALAGPFLQVYVLPAQLT